jgi:hypothetical protein
MAGPTAGFSPVMTPFLVKITSVRFLNSRHSFPHPAGLLQAPSSPASVMGAQPGKSRFHPKPAVTGFGRLPTGTGISIFMR